jgi:hypothetical protein
LTTLTEFTGNETSEKLEPASAVPALEKPVACAQSAKLPPPEPEELVVEAAGVGVEPPPTPSGVDVVTTHALAKSATAIGRRTSRRRR